MIWCCAVWPRLRPPRRTSHRIPDVRPLLYALVLLNVVFFAWANWIDVPAPPSAPAPALPALHLVANNGTEASPAGPRCVAVGPFTEAAGAADASAALVTKGLHPRDRLVEAQSADGFWVYLQFTDAAARRRAVARLQSAGIRDAASMGQPELADRISVGVFSERDRAERRASQVKALGFEPEIEARQRTSSAHWLDVDLGAADSMPRIEDLSLKPGLTMADCPPKTEG
jgi:hypothetical protein